MTNLVTTGQVKVIPPNAWAWRNDQQFRKNATDLVRRHLEASGRFVTFDEMPSRRSIVPAPGGTTELNGRRSRQRPTRLAAITKSSLIRSVVGRKECPRSWPKLKHRYTAEMLERLDRRRLAEFGNWKCSRSALLGNLSTTCRGQTLAAASARSWSACMRADLPEPSRSSISRTAQGRSSNNATRAIAPAPRPHRPAWRKNRRELGSLPGD